MFIYKITNTINNKCYIGQTANNPKIRFKQHRSMKNCGNQAIYRAFRKYGIENFTFNVILECCTEDVNYYEEQCILLYNSFGGSGYNMTTGGAGSPRIFRPNTWAHKSVITRKKNGHSYQIRTVNYEIEDLLSNTIFEGNCLIDFCRENKLSIGNLWETFYGRRKQHKGYKLLRTFND